MEETEHKDVFNTTEIGSLFDPIEKEEKIEEKIVPLSLFEDGDSSKEVKEEKEEEEEEEKPNLFHEETDELKKGSNSYTEAIKLLVEKNEDFLIYEGDDLNEVEYTAEQYQDLYQQNLKLQGEKLAESILENAISNLSPVMQKVLAGEFKGVSVSDLVKELSDFQELEKIPENPTQEDKEKIIKLYYNRLAKERNKDSSWVSKQVEKIIDRDELDSEYEDAVDLISQDLDKKQKEKEDEILAKQKEKEDFKKYHTYFVNEALKEDNLFGISLSKQKKEQIANVLSTFSTRSSDKKEKLGLTALIDSYIHSENPKETYKILGLMSLAAVAPNELVEQLKISAEKKSANDTMKKLKVADKLTSIPEKKVTGIKKIGSIF